MRAPWLVVPQAESSTSLPSITLRIVTAHTRPDAAARTRQGPAAEWRRSIDPSGEFHVKVKRRNYCDRSRTEIPATTRDACETHCPVHRRQADAYALNWHFDAMG